MREFGLTESERLVPRGVEPDNAECILQSPLSVGLYAGKWCSYAAGPDLAYDQREEDGGALVFETPPLGEPLEILGRPFVELELRVDRPVAMVAARLSDVSPDGRVTTGWSSATWPPTCQRWMSSTTPAAITLPTSIC